MALDRTARFFIDTSDAENGLDRLTRKLNLMGTQAEQTARQSLIQLTRQMEEFINTQNQIGRNARGQFQQQNPFLFFDAPQIGPGLTAFQDIKKAMVDLLPDAERARFEFVKLIIELERMGLTGNVSAQSIQSLNTRLGLIRPTSAAMAAAMDQMSNTLQRLQNNLTRTNIETKQMTGALQGLPIHSAEASQQLTRLSSASQGLMLGLSVLNRNVVGAAFSLIFLRFSIIKIVAIVGLFTVVIASAVRGIAAFIGMLKSASGITRQFEADLQRMASFLRSGRLAQELATQADEIARRLGFAGEETREFLFQLERVGQRGGAVIRALTNAAAATGMELSEVAGRFVELIRAAPDQVQGLLERFGHDFDISIEGIRNSTQLAAALQERFFGSAAARAATFDGEMKRLSATWNSFKEVVGTVVNAFLAPFVGLIRTFSDGLVEGFTQARNASRDTGQLSKDLNDLRGAVQRLMPMMFSFGTILGGVVFSSIQLVIRISKVMIETFLGIWRRLKPVRDALIALGRWLKEHVIDNLIEASRRVIEFFQEFERTLNKLGVPDSISIPVTLLIAGIAVASAARIIAVLGGMISGAIAGLVLRPIVARLGFLVGGSLVFTAARLAVALATIIAGAVSAPVLIAAAVIAFAVVLTFAAIRFQRVRDFLRYLGDQVLNFGALLLEMKFRLLFGGKAWSGITGLLNDTESAIINKLWPAIVVGFELLHDAVRWTRAGDLLASIGTAVANFTRAGLRLILGVALRIGGNIWGNVREMLEAMRQDFENFGLLGLSLTFNFRIAQFAFHTIEDMASWIKDRLTSSFRNFSIDVGFNVGIPGVDLFPQAHGGIVPGPRGRRVPVLAEAGEIFGGHPTFFGGRPPTTGGGAGGGGGDTFIFQFPGAVISSDRAMDQLADSIAQKFNSRLSRAHRVSRHRI